LTNFPEFGFYIRIRQSIFPSHFSRFVRNSNPDSRTVAGTLSRASAVCNPMNAKKLLSMLLAREKTLRATVIALGAVVAILQMGLALPRSDASCVLVCQEKPAKIVVPEAAVEAGSTVDQRYVANCLVEAVIQVESGGIATKIGRAGERGIMQIKRATWRETSRNLLGRAISFDLAFHPVINRRIGKAYLAELQEFLQSNRKLWKADERSLLLACYNAGPERVRQAGFDVRRLPAVTRSYVERATALHEFYLAKDAVTIRNLLLVENDPRDWAGQGS
jgi:hypothetical protein